MRRDRRRVIAGLGALAGGSALPPLLRAAGDARVPWRNWSGAQVCLPASRVAPDSEQALADWLAAGRGTVRPVGAGHSFSALVPTDDHIVSVDKLSGMICHDPDTLTADFWAGTRLSAIGDPLLSVGQALENMSDIDYQTLGGALATSTHGTGLTMGSMSTQVTALRLITPSGEIIDCSRSREPELFLSACVSLGAYGVISRFRLQNRARYKLRERNWLEKTESLLERVEDLKTGHRHFEMMPLLHSDYALAITADETEDAFTAPPADDDSAFVVLMDKRDQYGRDLPAIRSWLMNLVAGGVEFEDRVGWSHRILANVRNVRWNEMEYQVPAEAGPACLREILRTVHEKRPHAWFPLEYRYVRGDDLYLSPFHDRDACSISVHQSWDLDYHHYFGEIEKIFWKYDGRPHWGKLHTLNHRALSTMYPYWDTAMAARERVDPDGRMLNGHLRSLFGL